MQGERGSLFPRSPKEKMPEQVFEKANYDIASVSGKVVKMLDVRRQRESSEVSFINILSNKIERFDGEKQINTFK